MCDQPDGGQPAPSLCRCTGKCQLRHGRTASVARTLLPLPPGIAMPMPGPPVTRPSRPTTRNATSTANVPKITDPEACPISNPAGPNFAPYVTNGIVPNVARPQLNAVESTGYPRLLNAALATNSAPVNRNPPASQEQNSCTSSAVTPLAENARTNSVCAAARMPHATSTVASTKIK